MKSLILVLLVCALVGCDTLEESGTRAGNGLKQNYDTTRRHLSKWIYRWNDSDMEKASPPEIPTAYCYNVRADVLCYAEPKEHLKARFVGYQGTNALSPDAPPPLAATAPAGGDAVWVSDVPPPFAPASAETMVKAGMGSAAASSYPASGAYGGEPGAPVSLMK